MNTTTTPRMTNLFLQLGLDASEEGIRRFIQDHRLCEDVHILEASCWNASQADLLSEMLCSDGEWALVVDQLSEALRTGVCNIENS